MIGTSFAGAIRAGLLACALVAVSMPAHAQRPSANAISLARQIIDLKGSGSLLDPMVPGVIERVKYMLMQTNPMLQKALDEVALALRKQYASRTKGLLDNLAKLYASRFTEAELRQILAFYKSPAGKKVIVEEPQIFDENLRQLKDWQDKFADEILARFRAEMRKRGHDL
jgi:uncharacterized protein